MTQECYRAIRGYFPKAMCNDLLIVSPLGKDFFGTRAPLNMTAVGVDTAGLGQGGGGFPPSGFPPSASAFLSMGAVVGRSTERIPQGLLAHVIRTHTQR